MMLTPKDIEFLRGNVGTHQTPLDKVNLGDILIKPGISIEGLSSDNTMFRVFGRIDTLNGIDINAFILKEVTINDNGEFVDADTNRQKMTINRHVCNTLGIEFQTGLELWPIESNFIRYNDFINGVQHDNIIDYSNMGTYPCDRNTGLIKKICVELTGFRIDGDTLLTPTGGNTTIGKFLESIRFTNTSRILNVPQGKKITFIPINANENEDFINQIKTKGTMCFELNLEDLQQGGIDPNCLNGLDIDDIVHCSWFETKEVNVEFETPRALGEPRPLFIPRPLSMRHKSREEEIFEKLNQTMELFERDMYNLEKRFNIDINI